MRADENLFSRRFWMGRADARPLALYRILLGIIVLYDAFDRLRDFHAHYSELGVLPRAVAMANRAKWNWSIFDMTGPWRFEAVLWAAGMVAALALVLGFHTRLANFFTWVFVLSVQNRNPFLNDGSDVVMKVMLFWLLFSDAGARYSLDCALGRRSPAASAPAFALGLLRVQVGLVFFFTTVDKWKGGWWDGHYLYQVMQSRDFARWLAPSLLAHPQLCKLLTRGTLVAEAAIPLLLWNPFAPRLSRALGIAADLALFAGIFSTMAVGNFPAVMSASMVLFVLPEWLDAVERRFRITPLPRSAPSAPSASRWLIGVALAQLAIVIAQVSATSFPHHYARWFESELSMLGLVQNWPMFARGMPHQGRWEARGELTDDNQVDVFAAVAPQMNSLGNKTRYSRWYKLRFSFAAQRDNVLYDALAVYMCRRYNGTRRPHLKRIQIVYHVDKVPDPGQSAGDEIPLEMYTGLCELDAPQGRLEAHLPGVTLPPP